MKIDVAYQKLRDVVLALEPDVKKAEAGNKAAGRRVRKGMQDIKKQAQELRINIQQEFKK